ncbi:hypothetical protein [Bradyrhizobium sp. Gha]|uniref:hypothetical protein n=1 Tax=Bradyrhizobium sp. Gha TaxID=1855318 RepID=UPI0008DF0BB4|nr:hypothetical protein [Bradyrhizobium sp. Gha]SFI48767.1 UDP-glucuronate decarboxylase [Bradyrhizobium sp. Gha]
MTGPIKIGNNSEFTSASSPRKSLSSRTRSKLVFKPLPQDDPRRRQPDLAKTNAVLEWQPKVALENDLKETIAYFKHSLEVA